jgi:hypothetical protein
VKAESVDRIPTETTHLTTESWDWVGAMRGVAAGFRGVDGVFLQLGDSLTMAMPNAWWALRGVGHSLTERAFLAWAHAGEKNERDGWYLAVTTTGEEDPPKRTFTAAMGCSARYLLTGEKGILPLDQLVETYRPRVAVYLIGVSDVIRGTPVDEYIGFVEQAVDVLTNAATVPILATVTPSLAHNDQVLRMNDGLKALAERRRVPLLDVYAAMSALCADVSVFLGEDGVHLTWREPKGGPGAADFLRSGYLLRGYVIVRKGMEVWDKVLDAPPARGRPPRIAV